MKKTVKRHIGFKANNETLKKLFYLFKAWKDGEFILTTGKNQKKNIEMARSILFRHTRVRICYRSAWNYYYAMHRIIDALGFDFEKREKKDDKIWREMWFELYRQFPGDI